MATAANVVHAHIVKTPGVRGKARIDGTRVCVVEPRGRAAVSRSIVL